MTFQVYLSGNHIKTQLSVKFSNDTGHYKMGVWFLLCSGSEKHDLSHQLERFHGCNNKHSAVRRLCAHTLTQPGRNRGNLGAFGASSRSRDAEEEGHQREEVKGRVSSPIMDVCEGGGGQLWTCSLTGKERRTANRSPNRTRSRTWRR